MKHYVNINKSLEYTNLEELLSRDIDDLQLLL